MINPVSTLMGVWLNIIEAVKQIGQNINDIKVFDLTGWEIFGIAGFTAALGIILFKIAKVW